MEDAILIAAAPELLDACLGVLTCIEDAEGFAVYHDRLRSAVVHVKAAIAKAEGR